MRTKRSGGGVSALDLRTTGVVEATKKKKKASSSKDLPGKTPDGGPRGSKALVEQLDGAPDGAEVQSARIETKKKHRAPKGKAKLAQAVAAPFQEAADNALLDHAPQVKAVMDAVGPTMLEWMSLTAEQIAKDPVAMERVSGVVAKLGKEGFREALKGAGPEVSKAFLTGIGVEAMDPKVAAALLRDMPAIAAHLNKDLGLAVAKTCTNLEAKLGVTAAKEASTASKAIPYLGNAVSVATTALAIGKLYKAFFGDSKEAVAKEGLNTLLQMTGILFPWVGLGGDVLDLAWSVRMEMKDKDLPDDRAGKKAAIADAVEAGQAQMVPEDVIPLVAEPIDFVAHLLDGAEKGDLAKSFHGLSRAVHSVADDRSIARGISKRSKEAFTRTLQDAAMELDKAKKGAKGPEKEALDTLANAFGELFKLMFEHNKKPKASKAELQKRQQRILDLLGDATMAAVALETKDAS